MRPTWSRFPTATKTFDIGLPGNELFDTTVSDVLGQTLELDDLGDAILRVRWQNPEMPCDASRVRSVSPLDALQIINYLNVHGTTELPARFAGGNSPGFLDATGDGQVAPQDVLMIVNYLNSHSLRSGEGELATSAGPESFLSSGRLP